jgi:hypothetical protein
MVTRYFSIVLSLGTHQAHIENPRSGSPRPKNNNNPLGKYSVQQIREAPFPFSPKEKVPKGGCGQSSHNTRQAFTPGLFQAKLPPALGLPPTMWTRPIRTRTPILAALPRAPAKPSPWWTSASLANPSRIIQRRHPHTCPRLTNLRGNSPVLKTFTPRTLTITRSSGHVNDLNGY